MPCYCDNHLKNKIAGNHFNMLHLTSHPSTQRLTLLIAGQCRCAYLYRYSYLYSYNSWCERPFMHNQQRSQITHLLYTVSSVKLWNVHRGCPQVRTVPLTLESALSVGGMKAHTPYRKIRKLAEFGRNDTGGTREFREVKWGLQERQMTSFFFLSAWHQAPRRGIVLTHIQRLKMTTKWKADVLSTEKSAIILNKRKASFKMFQLP